MREGESLDWGDSIGVGKQCLDLGIYFEDGADRFPMYSREQGRKTDLSNWVNKGAAS